MIRVSEIFGPTIQGEGALIGRPTIFVRTGGCDYRCVWCDTPHAVDSDYRHEWQPMSAEDVWSRVCTLSDGQPLVVSLSGGNPAIQPLQPLIALGRADGYEFAMETQGSIARDWFADLDMLILSPKPPSSAMATDWGAFDQCLKAAGKKPEIILKFVVFDEADYQYAKTVASRYPDYPVYLQPGNHTSSGNMDENGNCPDTEKIMERMRWLVGRVGADRWFSATILPQLHVLIWGNQRGV